MSFAGLRVLSLESRRAAEIELLIRKQEGDPFVAPSVKERALSDHAEAFLLLEGLEQGRFELLILMTGVGLTFWNDVISARYDLARAENALRNVKLLVRGPKPTAVLRQSGINPDIIIPEPNTWREIVRAVAVRPERKLAVQEYGRPNPEFVAALESLGAQVATFALYRWEFPDDVTPLREAAHRLARREADTILFTSSVQLEHLLAIAEQEHLADQVKAALREHVAIASIGPIMTEALVEQGLPPDIEPSSPKMGPLVYAAANKSSDVLRQKRRSV